MAYIKQPFLVFQMLKANHFHETEEIFSSVPISKTLNLYVDFASSKVILTDMQSKTYVDFLMHHLSGYILI